MLNLKVFPKLGNVMTNLGFIHQPKVTIKVKKERKEIVESPEIEEEDEVIDFNELAKAGVEVIKIKEEKMETNSPEEFEEDFNLLEDEFGDDDMEVEQESENQQLNVKCHFCHKEVTEIANHYGNVHLDLIEKEYQKVIKEETNQVQCPHCQKLFNGQSINKHFLMIHQEAKKEFKCQKCKSEFHLQRDLNRHDREAHLYLHFGQPDVCPYCDLKLGRIFLANHILRRHLGEEKKYECSICSVKYYTHLEVEKHMLDHEETIEDPTESCPLCHEVLGRNKIKDHIKAVHSKIVKMFHCDICIGVKFESKEQLKNHCQQKHSQKPRGRGRPRLTDTGKR